MLAPTVAQRRLGNKEALEVKALVEAYQSRDLVGDAATLLDRFFGQQPELSPAYEGMLLIQRAACRRYLGDEPGAVEDLDRAEILLVDEPTGDVILSGVHGVRALLALDAGLPDV